MAQDLNVAGEDYLGVPGINLRKINGGTVYFPDVSGITAEAADVLAPKVIVDKYGNPIAGTMLNIGAVSVDLTPALSPYTVAEGYHNGLGRIRVAAGSAGTPTAIKSAPLNHSVLITPNVVNEEGYIAGGSKNGTPVLVQASELVSGSQTFAANGTFDVTNLAEAIINVAGNSGLPYETGTFSPEADISRPSISFVGQHSEAPVLVAMSDTKNTPNPTNNSNMLFTFFDMYKLWGYGVPYSGEAYRWAFIACAYRSTSSTSLSTNGTLTQFNSDDTGTSTNAYTRYWVDSSGFRPYSSSGSRYWRAGRTYKWIAIWKAA